MRISGPRDGECYNAETFSEGGYRVHVFSDASCSGGGEEIHSRAVPPEVNSNLSLCIVHISKYLCHYYMLKYFNFYPPTANTGV